MGNLTCRHLSLWVYNTGWALWANLLFESLILLFSCRAFTCLHPPAARCTASASVPPTCMLPWHQPCTSSTSQPREGHHSCFWSPQLSRADTWLRELQGRRGENGPQGFWEGDFFFFFFFLPESYTEECTKGQTSQHHLPVSGNKGQLSFTLFILCKSGFVLLTVLFFSFFSVDTAFEGQAELGCCISCVLVRLRSARL